MDVQTFVERLRQELADLPLREIDAAAGLDAALDGNRATPAIYLLPLAEKATPTSLLGHTEHREERQFGVLQMLDVRDFATPGGQLPQGLELAALRQRIKAALVGWTPDPSTGEPVRFDGGELIQLRPDGRLLWGDRYTVTAYYRT